MTREELAEMGAYVVYETSEIVDAGTGLATDGPQGDWADTHTLDGDTDYYVCDGGPDVVENIRSGRVWEDIDVDDAGYELVDDIEQADVCLHIYLRDADGKVLAHTSRLARDKEL